MLTRRFVLVVVGVCCLLLSGLGGFGSFRTFVDGAQQVVAAGAAFTLADSVVGGDPGGTSVSETVVGMVPGDFRERLVTLTPNSDFRPGIGISVAGSLTADLTPSSIPGVSQGGDALNILEGSNAGSLTGLAAAGQGGLYIEVWSCVGVWSSVDGVIGTDTADRDYSCSSGGDGTRITAYDVPTTGESYTRWIVSPLSGPTTLLLRTRLTDDGTTDGRQNTLGAETVNLTHRFTAATYREQNDLFNNATPIVELQQGQSSPTFSRQATRATHQPGEVSYGSDSLRSLWWRYTPTVNQTVNLTVSGSGGSAPNNVTHWVGTGVGSGGLGGWTDQSGTYGYNLTGGTTYYIRLTPNSISNPTTVNLTLARALAGNDEFSGATTIAELAPGGSSGLLSGSAVGATFEPGEVSYGSDSRRSLWWRYTPTVNQTVNLTVSGSGGSAPNNVTRWVGTGVGSGGLGGWTDQSGTYGYNLTGGTTYYIRLTPNSISNPTTVNLTLARALAGNDEFSGATTIAELAPGGSSGLLSGSAVGATFEPGEVSYGSDSRRSLWWRYTPTVNQTVNLTVSGSGGSAPNNVTHWVGTGVGSGGLGGWTDQSGTYGYNLTGGTTYYIRLTPNSISNPTTVNLTLARALAGNDEFSGATTIAELAPGGSSGLLSGSAVGATFEPGEVSYGSDSRRSLWWRYTPTVNQTVNLTVSGSGGSAPNNVTHWVGTGVGSGGLGGWTDQSGTYGYNLTGGTTYYIRLTPNSISNPTTVNLTLARP